MSPAEDPAPVLVKKSPGNAVLGGYGVIDSE
jgi:hypothetical protein